VATLAILEDTSTKINDAISEKIDLQNNTSAESIKQKGFYNFPILN
jgi:hypothetical protein